MEDFHHAEVLLQVVHIFVFVCVAFFKCVLHEPVVQAAACFPILKPTFKRPSINMPSKSAAQEPEVTVPELVAHSDKCNFTSHTDGLYMWLRLSPIVPAPVSLNL